MRSLNWYSGVACGAVLAIAGGFSLNDAIDRADGQPGFRVTAEQLQINQRISQASVRRSNRALNYLAPIRTTTTDAADDGNAGVKPLSQITGAGQGWTTGQIADTAITEAKLGASAVTEAKLANSAVTEAKLADSAVTEAKLAEAVRNRLPLWAVVETDGTLRRASAGVTSLRVNAGNYRVDFGDRDMRNCAYTGTQDEVTAANLGFVGIEVDATDATRLFVRTTDQAGTSADRPFNVQVTC